MSESYLYLVEILGVGVKVGITQQPLRRLAAHARDASAYGREIGRTWTSPVPHANARDNESAIKGESRREYLARTFEDCLTQAAALPMVRAEDVDIDDTPLNRFLIGLYPGFGEWLKTEAAR